MIIALATLHQFKTDDKDLLDEIEAFKKDKRELFQEDYERPTVSILMCMVLNKYYPRMTEVIIQTMSEGLNIEIPEEGIKA